MTLSDDRVYEKLSKDFVLGYKNITGEKYSGRSGKYDCEDAAVYTTNGAGPRNLQLFIMNKEGIVLTCLPGFWAAEDLLCEIDFALGLDKIWSDKNLSSDDKNKLFKQAHLNHTKCHSHMMIERSHLQGFDAQHEDKRGNSDFLFKDGDYRPNHKLKNGVCKKFPQFKTCDQVMHERMAVRAFLPYEKFDVAKFSDYGKTKYDKKIKKPGDEKKKDKSPK